MKPTLFVAVVWFAFQFSVSWLNTLLILCPVISFSLSLTSVPPCEHLSLLSDSLTFSSSTLFAFLKVSDLMSDF